MKPSHVDKVLDAKGLYCPEPIMLLHEIIREVSPGDIVLVKATDPSTERDIPKFCNNYAEGRNLQLEYEKC